MRVAGLDFEEERIALFVDGMDEQIRQFSAAGKVPVLLDGDTVVWDSLAICEYIAESNTALWPSARDARAVARSVCAEMHSGFEHLRGQMPMNCRRDEALDHIDHALQSDIDRVCEIWRDCRSKFASSGEYLFGAFSVADAMFAPVVLRFNSYRVDAGERGNAYMKTILAMPELQEWITAGQAESEVIAQAEV